MCTPGKFEEAIDFNDDDLINDNIYEVENTDVEGNKLTNDAVSYIPAYSNNLALHTLIKSEPSYIFALFTQENIELRAATLLSQIKGKINHNLIILDSQSTVDLFCNASLLTKFRVVEQYLNIHCDADNITTSIVGDLEGYGTVWYHAKEIANILSLYRVTDKFHVEFDSRTDNNFVVWHDDDSVRYFKPGPRGLYYLYMLEIHGTVLVNYSTVHDP